MGWSITGAYLATVISKFHVEKLKEPISIFKILEVLFAILVIACTASFGGSIRLSVDDCGNSIHLVNFTYPFFLTLERVPANLCSETDETVQVFHQNFVTNSRFFVCIGVLALIYSDCAVSGFIALFFFISSIAWCAHLRALKIASNEETISRFLTILEPCKSDPDVCHYNGTTEMSALDIGVVAGFLSFAVWSINVWFLYKEYPYFSSPQDPYNSSVPETPAPTPILRIKPSLKGKNKKVHYVEI